MICDQKMLTRQFTYNLEANRRMIGVLSNLDNPPIRSLKLGSHILTAHNIWINRIEQLRHPGKSYGVWEMVPANAMNPLNEENYVRTVSIISGTSDPAITERVVRYSNTKGEEFATSVDDILFHVLAHSAYHRGQLAMDLKEHGIEPPVTDFIAYVRSGW